MFDLETHQETLHLAYSWARLRKICHITEHSSYSSQTTTITVHIKKSYKSSENQNILCRLSPIQHLWCSQSRHQSEIDRVSLGWIVLPRNKK